jgi:hypothetical protein
MAKQMARIARVEFLYAFMGSAVPLVCDYETWQSLNLSTSEIGRGRMLANADFFCNCSDLPQLTGCMALF